MNFSAYAFDVDGTLTESKSRISNEVADRIIRLLQHRPVAIISGGSYQQLQEKIVQILSERGASFHNLHLYPLSGGETYVFGPDRGWFCVRRKSIDDAERIRITNVMRGIAEEQDIWMENTFGYPIEDRLCQVTFSAWGQNAPLELKRVWDPSGSKRKTFQEALMLHLPTYTVRVGGLTSVDVTSSDVHKGTALREFADLSGVFIRLIAFVGDQLQFGGNDHEALNTGARCFSVQSPAETIKLIDHFLDHSFDLAPNRELAHAVDLIIQRITVDPGYAWGWHSNIAVALCDEGIDHNIANLAAARFIATFAQVDMTQSPYWTFGKDS